MAGFLTFFMYCIGIVWVVFGSLMVFTPELLRQSVYVKIKHASLKKLSVIPVIIGVLLLLAASYNRYTFLIILLGLFGLLKGVFGILAAKQAVKVMDWWVNANNALYRVCGIVVIIIGSLVLTGL